MPLGRNLAIVDRLAGLQGTAQVIGLRVIPVFKTGTPPGVGLTAEQELLELRRFAKGIRRPEQLQYRRRFQFQRPMTVGVIFRPQSGQAAVVFRCGDALAQGIYQG